MHTKRVQIGGYATIDIDIPDICPHCGKSMELFVVDTVRNPEDDTIIILAECSISTCHKYFSLEYHIVPEGYGDYSYSLIEYNYSPQITIELPEKIEKFSPKFVEIYKQALLVKQYHLDDILGLAYRKAVEFLIKDYAIYINPEKESDYKSKFLGDVIKLIFKDNERLLKISKATVYVGNDFTHYEARNPDKDIKDMERFIELLISSINSELVYLEVEKFVDSK